MLCSILSLYNSDKAKFYDLKKRVDKYYVLNKAEYPRTVTALQNLLLNFRHNYNSNSISQYQCASNQLMFAQSGETGDDEGETKGDKTRRNLDHITCNYCGEKLHYTGNN